MKHLGVIITISTLHRGREGKDVPNVSVKSQTPGLEPMPSLDWWKGPSSVAIAIFRAPGPHFAIITHIYAPGFLNGPWAQVLSSLALGMHAVGFTYLFWMNQAINSHSHLAGKSQCSAITHLRGWHVCCNACVYADMYVSVHIYICWRLSSTYLERFSRSAKGKN